MVKAIVHSRQVVVVLKSINTLVLFEDDLVAMLLAVSRDRLNETLQSEVL